MTNEELLDTFKKVKEDLTDARYYLKKANEILNESVSFNNEGFKDSKIDSMRSRIYTQISNINNKIIENK